MRKRDYIREEMIKKELKEKGRKKADVIIKEIIEKDNELPYRTKQSFKTCYVNDYLEICNNVVKYLAPILQQVDTILYKRQNRYQVYDSEYDRMCGEIKYRIGAICMFLGIHNADDI